MRNGKTPLKESDENSARFVPVNMASTSGITQLSSHQTYTGKK